MRLHRHHDVRRGRHAGQRAVAAGALKFAAGQSASGSAGLQYAKDQDWLEYHENGTFVRMTQAGKGLFA